MSSTIGNLGSVTIDAIQDSGVNAVPRSVLPPSLRKPFASTKRVQQVRAVSGVDSGPNQTSIIRLATGMGSGWLVPNSIELSFKLETTQANGGTWCFASGNSAHALIQRLTVNQGTTLELINNYSQYIASVLRPFCMPPTYSNVEAMVGGCALPANNYKATSYDVAYDSATTTLGTVFDPATQFSWDSYTGSNGIPFSIPLISGLFNNTENSYIPLSLMSSNIEILIDWNNINNAFWCKTADITAYSVKDVNITYEVVQCPFDYENQVRASLQKSSNLWTIPISSVISSQIADSTALNYNLGLNVSSCDAVFISKQIAENYGSAQSSKLFTTSSGAYSLGSVNNDNSKITRRQLLIDGNQVLQNPSLNTDNYMLMETIRAVSCGFGNMDLSIPFNVSGNWLIPGSFRGSAYTNGFNLRNFCENDLVGCGTPVSLMTYIKDDALARSTDLVYLFAVCSMMVVLDGSGTLSLIR